jgi:hypothetical protein
MSQHIDWYTITDKDFTLTPGQWAHGEARNDGPALWFGDTSGDGAIIEAPSKEALVAHLERLLEAIKGTPEPPEPPRCKNCGHAVHLVPEDMAQTSHLWLHQYGSQWFEECHTPDLVRMPGNLVAAPLLTGV